MSVYNDNRSGRLFVQFSYNKQVFKQYLPKGATRTEANKLETKMRSDAFFKANGMAPPVEISFEELVQEYLGHIAHNKGKYNRAEIVLIAAKPFLKNKLIHTISAIDIERFVHYRSIAPTIHKRLRKPSTIWREVAVISAMFTFAIKSKYLKENPCKDVEKPQFSNIQNRILDESDELKFLNAFLDDTARDICILVLQTGLSRKDVFGLTDFQVHRQSRSLILVRSKTKEPMYLPLSPAAWNVIEPRLGKGLLFTSSQTGKKLTSIRTAIAGACRRAEIERLTIRDLRRSYGTRLDGDEVAKSRLLGHSDTRMLYRYARSTPRMREMVERLPDFTQSLPTEKLKAVK